MATNVIQVPFWWDSRSAAYRRLLSIYSRGPDYTWEDVVWNAWAAILAGYFPESERADGSYWLIAREAYRGGQPVPKRPDFAVVKTRPQYALAPKWSPLQALPSPQRGTDWLWVECKSASHDTEQKWHNTIFEIGRRLQLAHPVRPIPVIVAVGWKCLWLLWDPAGHIVRAPPGQPGQPGQPTRVSVPGAAGNLQPAWKPLFPSLWWWQQSDWTLFVKDATPVTPWALGKRAEMQYLDAFIHQVQRHNWEQYGRNPAHWQS
jgi:hypothetical protein